MNLVRIGKYTYQLQNPIPDNVAQWNLHYNESGYYLSDSPYPIRLNLIVASNDPTIEVPELNLSFRDVIKQFILEHDNAKYLSDVLDLRNPYRQDKMQMLIDIIQDFHLKSILGRGTEYNISKKMQYLHKKTSFNNGDK